MARDIVFFVFPQFQVLDVTGPLAAFEFAARDKPGAYRLHVVAAKPGMVGSSAGFAVQASALARVKTIDTLVIPGGDGVRAVVKSAPMIGLVRRTVPHVRRLVSICTGAYILASAGLLDRKRATTHWSRTADFIRKYPNVRLEDDRIFVKDGKIWTSAGITAGIDLALALIAEDLGEEMARRTARELVVYHRRPGGQSQHSALLEMERTDGRFAALLDYIRTNLRKRLDVAHLADRASMSPRHFARAFRAETGLSPAKAVERLRAEAARAALESGKRSIKDIARYCGFGEAERMRRTVIRQFGLPPSALRRG